MFNDNNRQDITDYFKNLVASDPRLEQYTEDLGIISLGNELGFKVDEAVKNIRNQFTEFYEPSSEIILLAKLMYELGYLRFQKPLIVSCTIKSDHDITLDKYQRFTDGIHIYILRESVNLTADTNHVISLTRGSVRTVTSIVEIDSMYHKIPLGTTYKKIFDLEALRGLDVLEYSQSFVSESSDTSLEVDVLGNLSLIIRRENVHGKNIILGDSVDVNIFETEPTDTIPTSMAIIGVNDIILTNIIKNESYEPYLSVSDMQRILKFNKNINNSIVYNEDYKGLIRARINGIDFLKVWQQEDEDIENGAQDCNINKVFCSYIPTVANTDLGTTIVDLIETTVYGKFTTIRTPVIFPISISIDIVNNSKKSIAQVKQDEVKSIISGYYDDVEKRLTKAIIYKNIVKVLQDHDIDIDIIMSDKSTEFINALFYNIDISDISISIVERDA